ncbi:hypothetical protein [Oscillatoria sp. FACHB-1406]|uniref:hypothetical protein n=1 Tax=Oscillatoria sp. FACHB-1406 TaxID=2692846 RepID=UPI001685A8FD|nr:hypothetical protein [Oscillatoria sp. FACHB-1406]MBD2576656.1 hypothetical protein [Oscillatoria sp. FACHB-1406]
MKRSIHLAAAILLSVCVGIFPIREGRAETESMARDILSLDCADADGRPSNDFERSDRNLSIGKRFYRAVMRAYPGAKITCDLPMPEDPAWKPTSALLTFGINDGRSRASAIKVIAYVDGSPSTSQVVTLESVGNLTIPINTASSLSLEVSCLTDNDCNSWLYFTQAEVQYIWLPEPTQ